MLPDVLIEGLRQYKSDTNALAAWLASTARICGYKCGFPDDQKSSASGDKPSSGQAPSGRLKAKHEKKPRSEEPQQTHRHPRTKAQSTQLL
jgi:hypothetical protein